MPGRKNFILITAFVAGLVAGPARGDIIYEVTLDLSEPAAFLGSYSGELVLTDGALDADGIFDLAGVLTSFSLDVPPIPASFTTSSLLLSSEIEYQVSGGALVGIDLFTTGWTGGWRLDFASLAEGGTYTLGTIGDFKEIPPFTTGCGDKGCEGIITVSRPAAVPEPTTAALLALAIVALAGSYRKQTA